MDAFIGTRGIRGQRVLGARQLTEPFAPETGGSGDVEGTPVTIRGTGLATTYRIEFADRITGTRNLNPFDEQVSESVGTGRVIEGSDTWIGIGNVTVANTGVLQPLEVEIEGQVTELPPRRSQTFTIEAPEEEPAPTPTEEEPAAPNVVVEAISFAADGPFDPDESVPVTVQFANFGGEHGSETFDVIVNGSVVGSVSSGTIGVLGQNTRTISIDIPAGATDIRVTVGGASTPRVSIAQPDVQVTNVTFETSAPFQPGQTVAVRVTFQNFGNARASRDFEVTANGRTIGSISSGVVRPLREERQSVSVTVPETSRLRVAIGGASASAAVALPPDEPTEPTPTEPEPTGDEPTAEPTPTPDEGPLLTEEQSELAGIAFIALLVFAALSALG